MVIEHAEFGGRVNAAAPAGGHPAPADEQGRRTAEQAAAEHQAEEAELLVHPGEEGHRQDDP